MIQPHELMIGNYVSFSKSEMLEDEKYQQVKELLKDECVTKSNIGMYSHCNYSDLHPIPLNKEWLVKLGFEPKYNYYYHPKKDIELLKAYKYSLCYDGNILVPVEYVHQLQNLYLSLTGEKLIIKE